MKPIVKTCKKCGAGKIKPKKGKGRFVRYKSFENLEIPETFAIPTCTNCNSEYIDEYISLQLDIEMDKIYWYKILSSLKLSLGQIVKFKTPIFVHEQKKMRSIQHAKFSIIDIYENNDGLYYTLKNDKYGPISVLVDFTEKNAILVRDPIKEKREAINNHIQILADELEECGLTERADQIKIIAAFVYNKNNA